ncbi:unnamed protein product [Amoebophrya sp. A120]|nr:unnamed protein product [Amoebophrya sp. A120]|eukprot:GSA120T00015411001.1
MTQILGRNTFNLITSTRGLGLAIAFDFTYDLPGIYFLLFFDCRASLRVHMNKSSPSHSKVI